jgi:phosphohistidine phosphatase
LNKRGKKAAPEMGRRLKKKGTCGWISIVSSDARRAVDTAASTWRKCWGCRRKIDPAGSGLYHATPDRILDIVYRFNDQVGAGDGGGSQSRDDRAGQRFYPEPIANLPTAGIVELRFDVSYWQRIDSDTLAFSAVDYPNNKSPR